MKTNRLRATMFGLLVAIISLGNVNAETFIVKGKVTDAADGSGIIVHSAGKGDYSQYYNQCGRRIYDSRRQR